MSRRAHQNQLRMMFSAGPGNVLGTYRHWRAGEDDPSQVAITYSSQFFNVVRQFDAKALIITWMPGNVDQIKDEQFILINRPVIWTNRTGLLWHLGRVWNGLLLILRAMRFRPHVFVAGGGTHWFMFRCLRLFGIRVVPSLHGVFWPKYRSLNPIWRLIRRLDKGLFRRGAFAIFTVSNDITKQVKQLTNGQSAPVIEFLPIFREELFKSIPPPHRSPDSFRILYAGRIEHNKGVFDLLWAADQLKKNGRDEIIFDICGDGNALSELKERAKADGLADTFQMHGHCDRTKMQRILGESHLLVVPTRTDLIEGFNKVVVEGILSGRPVITSNVCPAVRYVADAVVCVEPDNRQAYLDQILRLCDDRHAYEQMRHSTEHLRKQFYDESKSWGSAMTCVLNAVREGSSPDERIIEIPPQS